MAKRARIRKTRTGRRNRYTYDGGLPKLRRRGHGTPFGLLGAVEAHSLRARTDPDKVLKAHLIRRERTKARGVLRLKTPRI
jgi:hypothetical protein